MLINASSLGMAGQPPLSSISRLFAKAPLYRILSMLLSKRRSSATPASADSAPCRDSGCCCTRRCGVSNCGSAQRPDVTDALYDLVAADIDPGYRRHDRIGLTGSIAMGKSKTAKFFAQAGIPVVDSDAIVHGLYAKGGAAVAPIGALAPAAVVDGAIDRKILSQAMAEDPALLPRVETIVHPLVWAAQLAFLDAARRGGADMAVLDIPLLFEKRREKNVDKIVVTTCPPELQRERALARPGMTVEKLAWILDRQTPDAEKRRRADFIVDTSHGIEAARAEVEAIVAALRKGKHHA